MGCSLRPLSFWRCGLRFEGKWAAVFPKAAMAKLYASEAAGRICDMALQVHGGYGYTQEFPVERYLRDVRVSRI